MSTVIRRLPLFLLVLSAVSWSSRAHAFFTEVTAFYFSDSLNPGTESTGNRMFFDAAFGMPLDKKGRFVISWCVSKITYSQTGGSDQEISTLEHGPRFGWYIDKNRSWSVFATYNLFAHATFTDSEDLKWRGYSYKVDFGYTPMITDSIYLGARINYYAASYSEQFDADDTFSEVSTSQSMIFPSIAFGLRF